MANPLAQVIRYLTTGGTITANDVQAAIEQLETITTGIDTLLNDHNARHEDGGADEMSVNGLQGVLAQPQDPQNHASRHQAGGIDQIDVTNLLGRLFDQQTAGEIHNVTIDVTGLNTNYTLQFNGTNWIVTDNLVGVTPGVHESTHIEGGTDQIVGELLSPQKAGKIYSAVINIGGLADKHHLRYDNGTGQWVAQSFYHAVDHEQGGPDAIPSLPSPGEKSALVGTQGTPGVGNEYVTKLDKTTNIDPLLPTPAQKDALDASTGPGTTNPYVTIADLTSFLGSGKSAPNRVGLPNAAFAFTPVTHKKGTPVVLSMSRGMLYVDYPVAPTQEINPPKPIGVIDVPCIKQNFAPGSTAFSNAGTITPTDGLTVENISAFIDDNGFGRGIITLTVPVPAIIQQGDRISVSGANNPGNNGNYTVFSVAGNDITVVDVVPFTDAVPGGTITSNKYQVGSIILPNGTASNDDYFTVTAVNGLILSVRPNPVNETISPTSFDVFLPNGSIMNFGPMALDDGEPHDFTVSPSEQEVWYADYQVNRIYSKDANRRWIIGDQVSASTFFVNIRENVGYSQTVRIDLSSTPYTPDLLKRVIVVDATGAPIVINLPPIDANWDSKRITIKCRALGVNTITVNADAADDIDGNPSLTLTTQYQSWTLEASYDSFGNSFWSVV